MGDSCIIGAADLDRPEASNFRFTVFEHMLQQKAAPTNAED
jgi:hypothetical protein